MERAREPRPTPRAPPSPISTCGVRSCSPVTTDDKVQYTIDLDARVAGADPRIREVESTSYGDGLVEAAIASSAGVEASVRRTVCSASAVALAEADGQTQTGYGFSVGRSFADLDADQIVAMATERALRLLGARQPKGRRLPVVLDPLVTASFLGVLSAAFNGESMLKGRSLFLDRVGETVAAPHRRTSPTIRPIRSMPGATTHDSEGVPCRRNPLVSAGVLQGFLHNSATGAPGRHRDHRFGDARGLHVDARCRGARAAARAGHARPRRDRRVASRRALRAVGERPALGYQPDQRRLLGRRRRARWCATARSPSRCAR